MYVLMFILGIFTISMVSGAPYMLSNYYTAHGYWPFWGGRSPYMNNFEPFRYPYGFGYDYTVYNDPVVPERDYPPRQPDYESKLRYYGLLEESCEDAKDGLYYVDQYSFAFCSNEKQTLQPCADGAANPPLEHFTSGGYYGYRDFCSVNLLAHSYRHERTQDTQRQEHFKEEQYVHNYNGHRDYVYMPSYKSEESAEYHQNDYNYGSRETRGYSQRPYEARYRNEAHTQNEATFQREAKLHNRAEYGNEVKNRDEGDYKRPDSYENDGKYHENLGAYHHNDYEKHYIVEEMGKKQY